jgi:hypothetical protein
VISAEVKGFTLEGCMVCPGSSFDGYDGYDVIGVWWWLPVRGRPHDFGGRCLLWPIKDRHGLMPGT